MPVQTAIQLRRGTAASWTSTNPTLAAGEVGVETDTRKIKIGDGTTAWASLKYANIPQTTVTTKGDLLAASAADTVTRLAAGSNGDTLVANSAASVGLSYQANFAGAKNVLINGNMAIAQRGTSTTGVTNSDSFPCVDRWQFRTTNATWTVSQETDAPSGFGHSLKCLVTTAGAPTAAQRTYIRYNFEGSDVQRFKKGSAGALQYALSFWVKSNLTGTYTASLYDTTNNRLTSKSYTISSSATWEYKTIIFNADTTGSITADNARRFELFLNLSGGTNFTSGTLATAWESYTAANWMVGQVDLAATLNNYIQFTGVQLEAGAVSTAFQTYSGTLQGELAACQRYFQRLGNGAEQGSENFGAAQCLSTTAVIGGLNYSGTMRTSPTLTISSAGHFSVLGAGGNVITATALTFEQTSPRRTRYNVTVASGLVAGNATDFIISSASATLDASSEL